MKLFLPSSPTRRYARRHAAGAWMPTLLFGKPDRDRRERLVQQMLALPEEFNDALWGEDDEALVKRAEQEGRL